MINETSEAKIMIVTIFRNQQKTLLMNKVVKSIFRSKIRKPEIKNLLKQTVRKTTATKVSVEI